MSLHIIGPPCTTSSRAAPVCTAAQAWQDLGETHVRKAKNESLHGVLWSERIQTKKYRDFTFRVGCFGSVLSFLINSA